MWMTTEIEEAIKQRDEAKQNNDEPRYKEADEKVKDLITRQRETVYVGPPGAGRPPCDRFSQYQDDAKSAFGTAPTGF